MRRVLVDHARRYRAGKRIGIKDTVCIAGIPMSCASRLLYGFVPDIDATVITRILKAGGHITAILNTDDFAFSGGGHTSAYGVGLNPTNPKHTAGGSSCSAGSYCFRWRRSRPPSRTPPRS